MKRFEGKVALVTGGSKGIGAGTVERLLAEGAAVAIFGRNEAAAKETAAKLDPEGKKTKVVACDIGVHSQVAEAVKAVVAACGKIDVLVNNSGVNQDKMFHKMCDEDWNTIINTNLTGTYNVCREVFPLMREAGYGRIVNIVSISMLGNMGQANYAASKAGVQGLTRTLALEGGFKNITANCIAPGFIETDMVKTIPEETLKGFIKEIPLGRIGLPSDIAAVTAFLGSDDAAYVTGQTIIVSGGSRIV